MPSSSSPFLQSFVAGAFRPADTERTIAQTSSFRSRRRDRPRPDGTAADAAAAVAAAAEAGPAWRRSTGPARAEQLYRWAGRSPTARGAGAGDGARGRQADRRGARRGRRAASTILRYYAGEAVREIGEVIPAAGAGRAAVHPARAARRRRADHAVELPARHPAVEGGAGAGVRQHRGAQAGRGVVARGRAARRDGRRRRAPRRASSTSCSATAPPSARRCSSAPEVRGGELHRLGAGRRARSPRSRRERNIRYQTEMGGKNVAIVLARRRPRQAAALTAAGAMRYAGPEVHRDEPRRRRPRAVEDAFLDELRAPGRGAAARARHRRRRPRSAR